MREAYRLFLKDGKIDVSQKYMSLIFIGQEKALEMNFSQIQNTLFELLNGIKQC